MQIFISYSSKDRNQVKSLAEDLEEFGHTVWFDRELTGGQAWWDEILSSVRECELFIFALTPRSLDSYPCQLEYTYANTIHKRVLPIMLEEVPVGTLPPELAVLQFVDYRHEDKKAAIALNKALRNLPPARLLPNPLPPPPPAPISPLAKIRKALDRPNLDLEQQSAILLRLKHYLKQPETSNDSYLLLERMRNRPDLLANVAQEIDSLLVDQPPARPTSPGTPRAENQAYLTLEGHMNHVNGAAFSPFGDVIVTVSADCTGHVWEWREKTGTLLGALEGESPITSLNWRMDGERIVTTHENGMVRVHYCSTQNWQSWKNYSDRNHAERYKPYNLSSFQAFWVFWLSDHEKWAMNEAQFSRDGRKIITVGMDGAIRIWGDDHGYYLEYNLDYDGEHKFQQTLGPDPFPPPVNTLNKLRRILPIPASPVPLHSVQYSPDGRFIISASADGSIRLWDVRAEKLIYTFNGHARGAFSARFSPDGRRIVSAGADSAARLWDVRSGKMVKEFKGHTDAIRKVRYSPGGNQILTASYDCTARLWDAESGKALRTFRGHSAYVTDANFSPDGCYIVTASWDKTAKVWDISDLADSGSTHPSARPQAVPDQAF